MADLWVPLRTTTMTMTAHVHNSTLAEIPLAFLYGALVRLMSLQDPRVHRVSYAYHEGNHVGTCKRTMKRGSFPRCLILRIALNPWLTARGNPGACVMLWRTGVVHVTGLHAADQLMDVESTLCAVLRAVFPDGTWEWGSERSCMVNMITHLRGNSSRTTRFAGERVMEGLARSAAPIPRLLHASYEPELFSGTVIAYQPSCSLPADHPALCDCHRVTILLQRRGAALVYGARTEEKAREAWTWFLQHCFPSTPPIPPRS